MRRIFRMCSVLPAGALLLSFPVLAQTPDLPEKAPMEAPAREELPDRAPAPPPEAYAPGPDGDVLWKRESPEALDTPLPPSTSMSDEQEKEALEFYRQESPELMSSLEALKKSNPKQYRSELRTAFRDRQTLARLKKGDPERYEESRRERALDRASRSISQRYKANPQERDRQQLRADLVKVLDELFELREKRREATIKRLEEDLAKLRQTTERRRQNKDRIVSGRLEDLLGGDDDLRW